MSSRQIKGALDEYDKTLMEYGVNIKDLSSTAKNARKLSSTHGAGGILDLFYPRWKIDLTLNNELYYLAYLKLFQGTYGSYISSNVNDNDNDVWAHPYKIEDQNKAFAHIDRIGCRFPDDIVQSFDSRRQFQRGLAPHMDCCPNDINGTGGKKFPRWRPIQCLLSLTSTLDKNEGGFECVPKFHRKFKQYYENLGNTPGAGTDRSKVTFVGDFTPMRDPDVIKQYKHIPIPAGAALFWDQRLPHANSMKNESNTTRRCIYGGFLPYTEKNIKYNEEQVRRLENGIPQADFWMKDDERRLTENGIKDTFLNENGKELIGHK